MADAGNGGKLESAVEVTVARVAVRLLNVAYAVVVILVVMGFGAGVWVTEINSKIAKANDELERLTQGINELKQNSPRRWVANEISKIKENAQEISELREQILRMEIDIEKRR